MDIPRVIQEVLERIPSQSITDLEDVLSLNARARNRALELIKNSEIKWSSE
jgi:1-deoxy-D-xylulose 5-phosphate reductoisomerase